MDVNKIFTFTVAGLMQLASLPLRIANNFVMQLAKFGTQTRGQTGVGGVIDLFIGIMIVFFVLSALISPTETAVVDVTEALTNSTFTEVQNISDLPKVSYLIALIMVIVGLIYAGWGRSQ